MIPVEWGGEGEEGEGEGEGGTNKSTQYRPTRCKATYFLKATTAVYRKFFPTKWWKYLLSPSKLS